MPSQYSRIWIIGERLRISFLQDLSDEAMQFNSNHGCLFKAMTNSWPTAPVDPISATFNIFANGGHM